MAKNPKVEKQSARPPERRFRPVMIGECTSGIGDRAIRKRGFAEPRIVAEWERIVGADLGRLCRPVRLAERSGALVIKAGDGATAMRLQHMTIQIVERVNAYFGFRAVGRIQILQGVLPKTRSRPPRRAAPKPVSADAAARIDEVTDDIGDDALKAALRRLGRAIASDPAKS